MPPTLYLIDGHALAYRMYFALTGYSGAPTRWQTSAGEPTAGVYGFGRELLRIYEQEKPDYLAVAFDTGKTFRDEIYPEYKATRAKMPDDLRSQIERIREMVDAFNIPRLEVEGVEADDVLGSIARWAATQGLGVKIITGDRDLLQLVNERTIVYLAGDDQNYITAQDVVNKLHVRPDQVVDYKAIVGDKSDNIPGVPGVGEKTAESLLAKYDNLDAIYAHLEEIEPRWRGKLEAGKASAYMSQDLARIRTDVPVRLDLEQAKPDNYDRTRIEAVFNALEFRSLVDKLNKLNGSAAQVPAGTQMSLFGERPAPARVREVPRGSIAQTSLKTIIVDTPDLLDQCARALSGAAMISLDTETTSTDEMTADLVGISLAVREGESWYIPIGHRSGRQLPLEQVISALRKPLTDAGIPKIGHNLKYDLIMLVRHGLRVEPLGFDTMLAEYVLDPNSHNLGLKNMAAERLGLEMTHIEELIGSGKKQISMAEVAVEAAAPYAGADAETVFRLQPILARQLQGFPRLLELYSQVEVPLIPVLADMEMAGVMLDRDFFSTFAKELDERLKIIEQDVYQAAGKIFNLNSTQQLSDVLFGKLGLVPPDRGRKTASGHYSTAAGVLEEMDTDNPVVKLILEYRELSKLKSTYVDSLPLQIHPQTGRVHTSFSQTGTSTGRLSSSNPNLQNIPIRTELGRRVRRGFTAQPGSVLLSLDYSQIELRIVAFMSGDEAMLNAFRLGHDIHATTAAAIYDVQLEQVTKEQRRHAKAINFGLIYGMSAFGLTRSTELTLAESENYIQEYFREFPGVKQYLDGIRRSARENGYVETLLGRRRYFPVLKTTLNDNIKKREEREAINAPIQGTAADIMKIAMIRIPPALKEAGLHARLLLQVHDELVLECPRDEIPEAIRITRSIMENAYPMSIPLTSEARSGMNWDQMEFIP